MTVDLTPELALPSPQDNENANPPEDFAALTARLEEILAEGHELLWMPGDFKISSRAATHGRWLLCDASEKTQAEIEAACGLAAGQAADLVTLWGTGAVSWYGAAAAGKIKLPTVRGRVPMIAGPSGGGLSERLRGATGGVEAHTLTAAESGLPEHGHAIALSDADWVSGTRSTRSGAAIDGGVNTFNDGPDDADEDHENMPPFSVIGSLFVRV
jgi:microcystin-dependent protein